jgi:CheY-like chemotaxis protein
MPNLSNVRVLIVDDDPETLEMLRDGLLEFGAAVQTACSVEDARNAIALEPPDVIVSDLAMPVEDGLAFISRLRARRIDIPAVALTAHVRAEDRARVLAAGFQRYISKPTTPLEVAREIDAARAASI